MLHPDDTDTFYRVTEAAIRFARQFGIPLTGIQTKGRPAHGEKASYVKDGGIVITLRWADLDNGLEWEDKPRPSDEVYGSLAYELAILKASKDTSASRDAWFERIVEAMRDAGYPVSMTPFTARKNA